MRYFETRKARIEIIPMIDIMLFLLVFFAIVTLHMIPANGVTSRLPQSRRHPHRHRRTAPARVRQRALIRTARQSQDRQPIADTRCRRRPQYSRRVRSVPSTAARRSRNASGLSSEVAASITT